MAAPGLWLTSPAGWLPRTRISSGTLCSVIEYGLPLRFLESHIIWKAHFACDNFGIGECGSDIRWNRCIRLKKMSGFLSDILWHAGSTNRAKLHRRVFVCRREPMSLCWRQWRRLQLASLWPEVPEATVAVDSSSIVWCSYLARWSSATSAAWTMWFVTRWTWLRPQSSSWLARSSRQLTRCSRLPDAISQALDFWRFSSYWYYW